MRTSLGDQGSQVRVLSPRQTRNLSSRREMARCVGRLRATGCSALTRNDGFSCKRHHFPRLGPHAAAHSKRLWQTSAYIALTLFAGTRGHSSSDAPRKYRSPEATALADRAALGEFDCHVIARRLDDAVAAPVEVKPMHPSVQPCSLSPSKARRGETQKRAMPARRRALYPRLR